MNALLNTMTRVVDRFDPPRSKYLDDPVGWTEDVLSEEVWSKQAELMYSVADHRHTAVRSAHATGKSWAAARLMAWWLDVHPPGSAFAVSSAPTQPQVEAVLWREVGRAHTKGGLHGRITYGQVPMWKLGNEIVAYGRKPQDKVDIEQAMQAFQGIHARYILVILDEACGIPKWLFDAADTLATNDDARVLVIGNPDDPATEFAEVCKPGSGWNRLRISAYDTPAFTGEEVGEYLKQSLVSQTWVEERINRWGAGSMLVTSKIDAEFPEVSDDTLITPAMIRRAQENNELPGLDYGRFGCDIARYGDDETVIMRNRGGVIRCVDTMASNDTMQVAGKIKKLLDTYNQQVPAVIDVIGIGAGVYDRLYEQHCAVTDFNSSNRAINPKRFHNLRAEMWWTVREHFDMGLIDLDPDDEDLAAELLAIKYVIDSTGRIQIEKKEDTKKRLGRSPDRADALMMSCWEALAWRAPRQNRRVRARGITDDLLERAL